MNSLLEVFAKQYLIDNLSKLPDDWQKKFKMMYWKHAGYENADDAVIIDTEEFISRLPSKVLDLAVSQVERSINLLRERENELSERSKSKTVDRINYVKGDLIQYALQNSNEFIMIPHVCNTKGAWGAGFAEALSNTWCEPEIHYRKTVNHLITKDDLLGMTFYIGPGNTNIIVANMFAQKLNERLPLRYWALTKCMLHVGERCFKNPLNIKFEIYCPKFGSGLARGNWKIIERLIWEIWIELYPIKVTIFEL
jgi:hypothetical protein